MPRFLLLVVLTSCVDDVPRDRGEPAPAPPAQTTPRSFVPGGGWTGYSTGDPCEERDREVPFDEVVPSLGVAARDLPGFDGTPVHAQLDYTYAGRSEGVDYWFEPDSAAAVWIDSTPIDPRSPYAAWCTDALTVAGFLHFDSEDGTFAERVPGRLYLSETFTADFANFIPANGSGCGGVPPCVEARDLRGTYAAHQFADDLEAFLQAQTALDPADYRLTEVRFQVFFPGADLADLDCAVTAGTNDRTVFSVPVATLGAPCSAL